MQDKKIIVFDLDGVIIDSVALMSELTRGSFPGIDHQGIKDLHKENIYESVKKIALPRSVESEEGRALRMQEYSAKKHITPVYEGVKPLLFALAEHYTLVINTSAATHNCSPVLEHNGIAGCFDLVAGRELNPSKVEKFKIIAERYATKTADLLFITDTVGDVREAAEAGVPTIGVTWGVHDREDFANAPQEYLRAVVDTPAELLRLIESR